MNDKTRPLSHEALRKKAEQIANDEKDVFNVALSPEETQKLLYELRVHQIELGIRNEEMRSWQMELDGALWRYFDLYDRAPVGYLTVDAKGNILELNLTTANLLGVSKSFLIKKSLTSFLFPEDTSIFNSFCKVLIESHEPQSCELRMLRANSSPFWMRFDGAYVLDAENRPICRIALININERKNIENELKKSEEKFRYLFERMLNGFAHCKMVYDTDGNPVDFIYLDVNKAFEELTGLKDVVGKKVSEVIPTIRTQDPRLLEVYGWVAKTGKPENLELFVESLQKWFSISVYSPGKDHFVAVFDVISERKQVEQMLKQSEARYRKLVESTTDYIFTVRIEHGVAVETMHGSGCVAVTGYSSDDYKANPHLWYEMIFPEDRDMVVEKARQVQAGLVVEPFEHRIFHRDGKIRWLRNTIVVRKNDLGQVISYDGLVSDITQRMRTEAALRESEKRFSTVFRVNPVGVGLSRMSDNKFVDVNDAFSKIFGFTHDEIVGHTSQELGLWPDPQEREKMILELKKHGQVSQYECKFRRKSGEIGDLVVSTGLIDISGQEHLLGVTIDITESKKNEQKLKQASEEWERTFNSIQDLIFIQDKDMNILKINKACAAVLNLDTKDIIGKRCYDIVHHMNHPWISCPFEKSKKDRAIHTEEVNDSRLGATLLVTVSPIMGDNGEFLGAVHIAKDITEIKKAERLKQEHVRELEIFYKGSIGREERILELKEQIKWLNTQINKLKQRS